ncbi:ATP-binding cassette domain-containing protein [Uliginosibacterium gangwonense]|uniref:ATP-binding cassette domain-containing protein n=1 Tax=Uliginosibacterium gangwonense TaxID=392736 RepID=UPI00035CB32A|nr:ATP-binding cassette domain-containing protein [Uliginosibacterium gangwonense]
MHNHPIETAAVAAPQLSDSGIALRLQTIAKHYGQRQVLHDINLEIKPGEFVAIVGRSGCGKSTLLRLVAGLEAYQAGAILYDGVAEDRRHDTRIMFQDSRLLPWKRVIDNVLLGLGPDAFPLAQSVLNEVGLADRAHDWPARLSGGQRQRVALARALAHQPRLLLLDEPLGALDALTRIEMHTLIERLWREHGFTALLVTHDVTEAVALADRIVLIDEGCITLNLPVPLPRPRERGKEFAALEEHVLRQVLKQNHYPQPLELTADPLWPPAGQVRWAI